MQKKIVLLTCILCICACLLFAVPVKTQAVDDTNFQVGYARVDINPYVVDGDPTSGIMALPLAGTGDVWNRLSQNTLMDDNGDGVVDENDGLKATCIAVTDKNGTTALLITVDVIGMHFLTRITNEVMARVEAEIAAGTLTNVKLAKENIYAASTHTHNAPDTASYASAGKTGTNNDGVELSVVNENLGLWLARTVEDIGDAAILALKDRAAATLTKDQLSAADATDEVVAGKTMTMTRHYVVEQDGETFVAGDNFNATSGTVTSRGDDPKEVTEADDNIYLLNFAFEDQTKLPVVLASWRGHPSLNNTDSYENSSKTIISSDYVSAFRHALEYGVDVTVDKTNGVGNVTDWTLGTQQKYRVAFFNSTGGNTNPRGCELVRDENGNVLTYGTDNSPLVGYTWIDQSATTALVKGRGCSYGVVLATFANECITDGKNETVARPGQIVSATRTFKADRKTVGCSQLAYDAGKAYNAAVPLYNAATATYSTAKSAYDAYVAAQKKVDSSIMGEFLYGNARNKAKAAYQEAMATHDAAMAPYLELMTTYTNNVPKVSYTGTSYAARPDKPQFTHPFLYKNDAGETFAIGSKYHANYVIGDWNAGLGIPYTAGINVTVNAFMLGEDVAFVTIPGEPFDYYFKEPGIYTPENNLWNDLVGDAYGKPYILGYANGWQRYFPNYEAYHYNEGSTTKTIASYEVHNSDFEVGTGERAVKSLDALLAGLSGTHREAYCTHCGETVTWTPYSGQAKLSSGHYYLCSDYETENQLRFEENCTVCFDLNGYTLTGMNRAFYLDDNKNEMLSVMDSSPEQTGAAQGVATETGAARGYGGGTVYIGPGTTFNLYSGTLKFLEKNNYSCLTGTVLRARGVFNMYGGKVEGGAASSFTGQYINNSKPTTITKEGFGGAVYVDGSMSVYGGSITGGKHQLVTGEVFGNDTVGYGYRQTVEDIEGTAPCVYVWKNSSVLLAGDGSVENIYLAGGIAATKLTVRGTYTGTVEIAYPEGTTLELAQQIATAEPGEDGRAADVSCATITFKGVESITAAVKETAVLTDESAQSYIYCQHCREYLRWTAVTDAQLDQSVNTKGMAPGHYILTENVTTTQKQLNPDGLNPGKFCFDFNGYEFHGATRAFYVYNDATLNLQDSLGTGFVQGDKGANNYGGSMYCQGGTAAINVYGVTVKGTPVANLRGSAFFIVNGTVSLYDATVIGGHSKEYGGAVFCSSNSDLYVYGGSVVAGTTDGKGACVFLDTTGKLHVAGDAQVDQVYVNGNVPTAVTVEATEEPYTGTLIMDFATSVTEADTDVGNITGEQGMGSANITTVSGLDVLAEGSNLKTGNPAVSICLDGVALQNFRSLAQAVAAYEGSGYIRLNQSVTETVTVTRDVYLDLNGMDISGHITVSEGATLYCMDASTDDYDALSSPYGHVAATYTGSIQPVPYGTVSAMESATNPYRAGYICISRSEGLSFHRVNLQVKSIALRPGSVGIYYQSPFQADEVAAEEIYGFGIALSVLGAPNADNLETDCEYSFFESFEPGTAGNVSQSTGTLLQNIMRTTNTDAVNAGNAGVPIYGCAYVITENGYVFGEPVSCSLETLLGGIDKIFNTLSAEQQKGVLEMYRTYEAVMSQWTIPNIKETAQ